MKRIRLLDAVLLAAIMALAAGLALRACYPDAVSHLLTDLSRRTPVTVFVAVPNPWRQEPLRSLTHQGDTMVGEAGRDHATLVGVYGDSGYPVAVFHISARVDAQQRLWFNYAELLPGSNFAFRPGAYNMEGLVLKVESGFQDDPGDSAVQPAVKPAA